ncbi:cell division protein ZapA [Flavicella sediminum]|uniref:cell division protein ZapA n=1 Tax=Flavicella sediminum TaxID=2585141 RepID=UPI00111FC5D2|nr:cell division protein ZapA [Flavicella sediminum]
MANKFKIKVVIGGRTYPLHVNNAIEEEGTRKAADKINALIARFEQDYAVSDKQDVLAMCALQFASKLEINAVKENEDLNKAKNKLDQLHELLDANLG